MITYITGYILKSSIGKDSYVDILTNGGVGYRINIPNSYIVPPKNSTYSLYTYLHVREDAQTLFGFTKEEERKFFTQLINVSGVGPKIGLAILSMFSRQEIEELVNDGDARALSKVPGLGLKTAQKIILELRGKIDLSKNIEESGEILKEVKEALKALGFAGETLKEKISIAEDIVKDDKNIEIEALIKRLLI